jgi:ribonuclease P protein component
MQNGLPYSRAGVVASKRLGKAVTRNKIKRRIKEALGQISVKPGWDLVLIARVPAAKADFHQISKSVAQLLNRVKILTTSDQVKKRGAT